MKKLQIIFLCVFFGFLSPMTHLVNALTEFHLYTKLNQSEPFKDTSDGNRDPSDAFIITVKTDNAGGSADNQFIVPTRFGGYDYTIDTSDGQTINDLTGDYTITFPTPGTYDILISGDFPWYRGRYSADKDKLIEVKNWGIIAWENFDGAFAGCNNLTVISATDVPDLSNVTNLSSMFYGNNILEINNIENWDVSNVQLFNGMFYQSEVIRNPNIPIDLSGWDMSSATNISSMFQTLQQPTTLTFDLSNWDISNITNMTDLFRLGGFDTVKKYDDTLLSWEAQNRQSNIATNFGDSQYSCIAEAARDELINTSGWTIIDGGNESPNILTYDDNGSISGVVPLDNNQYGCNDIATILGNTGGLSKPCYSFNGWNTAADGTGTEAEVGDDEFSISESTTLYAQWIYDFSCNSVMITQYYEGNNQNKWIEIKNISGTVIPANALYIVSLQDADANDPANADLTSGPSLNSYTLISEALAIEEIRRFREPNSILPTYACPAETGYDLNQTYNLHADPFDGNDLIIISKTNDATTWNNRIDVIGDSDNWGADKVFVRKDNETPNVEFDINNWVEFSVTEVNDAILGSNLYLGDHFDDVTDFNGAGVYNGWSNGLPERSRTVTVTADYDTGTEGSFEAFSLETTGTVNVRADNYITIVNDLTVNARGVLNIDHQGSLVMVNNSGTITNEGTGANKGITNVSRKTSVMKQYDYHFWSSPIDYSTNTTPVASVLTDFFASRIYEYDTSAYNDTNDDNIDDEQDDWVNYSSDMKSGIGYAAMTSSPGERNTIFSGQINNGVISVNVELSNDENDDDDGDEDDWNLLGNPYPSAISADEFITQNSNINGTLYFWTHNTAISIDNPGPDTYNYSVDDYAMYNFTGGIGTGEASESGSAVPTGIIETGLGFFVDAVDAAISPGSAVAVEFNNSMRSKSYANNNSFSASSTNEIIEKDRFWLNLTNPNGAFSQILIGFFENATLEKDRLYDGVRLKGNNYIDFYSLDNTSYEYGIQGRPPFDENESIVLGYQSNILGNLSIDLGDREGVLSETPVYITDHYLSITHDLTIAPYSFNTEVGTFNDRFEIAFNEESLSTNDIQVDSKTLRIIELQNGQVQIKVPSQFEMASIQILDISGKVIYNFSTQGYSQTFSLNNLSKTAYLVTVELNNGQTITKKAIKRK
ncbi:BspA family leucine-rich repeat surface protein [Flavobacteriaceae bacterium]|nr:BspA family leucine-rich repeat surface protein [Flavobacteriaceae bacterium]MDC1052085.1 BspA family leucine-rich repeat surface protein [Flavobacteriaceae bacterium]